MIGTVACECMSFPRRALSSVRFTSSAQGKRGAPKTKRWFNNVLLAGVVELLRVMDQVVVRAVRKLHRRRQAFPRKRKLLVLFHTPLVRDASCYDMTIESRADGSGDEVFLAGVAFITFFAVARQLCHESSQHVLKLRERTRNDHDGHEQEGWC